MIKSLQVTVPQGSLCNLNLKFKAGLPPDAVYNIIIDPENKRVFKNIKVCISKFLNRVTGNMKAHSSWYCGTCLISLIWLLIPNEQRNCSSILTGQVLVRKFLFQFSGSNITESRAWWRTKANSWSGAGSNMEISLVVWCLVSSCFCRPEQNKSHCKDLKHCY